MRRPSLKDRRIAVTREAASGLCDILREHGATVHHCPLIRVTPAPGSAPLRASLADLAGFQWLVFTSINAVIACGIPSLPDTLRVACVGRATARALVQRGLRVDLLPERSTAKGLLAALAAHDLKGARVLYPRGALAPDTLKRGLEALGARVEDPMAYDNEPDEAGLSKLRDLLAAGAIDVIAFASASAVDNAAAVCGDKLVGLRLYSIGPSTTLALKRHGLTPVAEATHHDVDGLVAVILANEAARE